MLEKLKKLSPGIIYCIIAPTVLAILYLVGIADLEYGYYTFVRILSFLALIGVFCAFAYNRESVLNFTCIASAIVWILFNPIFPLYFDKEIWIVLDILSAITMFGVSGYTLYTATLEENRETPPTTLKAPRQKSACILTKNFLAAKEKALPAFSILLKAYMLDIPEWQLKNYVLSDYTKLSKILPKTPTKPETLFRIMSMTEMLLEEMQLSDIKNVAIINYVSEKLEELDELDEDDYANHVETASISHYYKIPIKIECLKDRLNYELYALKLIEEYAAKAPDPIVKAKSNAIHNKRNYSFSPLRSLEIMKSNSVKFFHSKLSAYMIDIPDGELTSCILSDYTKLSQFIPEKLPSHEEFSEYVTAVTVIFLASMQISEITAENVFRFIDLKLNSLFDSENFIKKLADEHSASLPIVLDFLKNQINYERVSLSLITLYAISAPDPIVGQKVFKLRKKMGYPSPDKIILQLK